jgi:hypothetical protein
MCAPEQDTSRQGYYRSRVQEPCQHELTDAELTADEQVVALTFVPGQDLLRQLLLVLRAIV